MRAEGVAGSVRCRYSTSLQSSTPGCPPPDEPEDDGHRGDRAEDRPDRDLFGQPAEDQLGSRGSGGDGGEVEPEHPSFDLVGCVSLQPVGRERPLAPGPHVADEHRQSGESEGRGSGGPQVGETPQSAIVNPIAPSTLRSVPPTSRRIRKGPSKTPRPRAPSNQPTPSSPCTKNVQSQHRQAAPPPRPRRPRSRPSRSAGRDRWVLEDVARRRPQGRWEGCGRSAAVSRRGARIRQTRNAAATKADRRRWRWRLPGPPGSTPGRRRRCQRLPSCPRSIR